MEVPGATLFRQDRLVVEIIVHLEPNLCPHGLHQLAGLLHIRPGSVGLQDNSSAFSLGLLDQKFGFIRVMLWPWAAPCSMPRTGFGKEARGNVTTAIKHRLMDRSMIDSVGRCLAQRLICKRPLLRVKGDKSCAQCWHIPCLVLPGVLLGKFC